MNNIHASLARHGVQEWYLQRLSAVVLLFLAPVALWLVIAVTHGTFNQTTLQIWLANPLIRVGHSLFALAVLLHGYIGIKIIIEDYLHHAMLRTVVIAVVQVISLATLVFWIGHIWL